MTDLSGEPVGTYFIWGRPGIQHWICRKDYENHWTRVDGTSRERKHYYVEMHLEHMMGMDEAVWSLS